MSELNDIEILLSGCAYYLTEIAVEKIATNKLKTGFKCLSN